MTRLSNPIHGAGVPQRWRGFVLLALLGKSLLAAAAIAVATPVLVLLVAGRCNC